MWAGRDASNRIIGYYSYLFSFPSLRVMFAGIAGVPAAACSLGFALAFGLNEATRGLLFGFMGLTVPVFLSDALALALLKGDTIMTPRKVTILSFASCIAYVAAALLFSLMVRLTGDAGLLGRGITFAIAIIASLRHLAITVLSTRGALRNLGATFVQPALCYIAAVLLLPISDQRVQVLGVLGAAILVGGTQIVLRVMGGWEDRHNGLRLLPLFRSFIVAWSEEVNRPLEEQLTRLGEIKDLYVDALLFCDDRGSCRAGLIVPYVHPGPFRNVGSSGLPLVLAERLGGKLGCEVVVPHGVSTHELDLTRSAEMSVIADAVSSNMTVGNGIGRASDIVWAERDGAKASCQMFGDVALITLTLSPKSYDDLPEELGERITSAAREMGVTAVVVDSHNSIEGEDELDNLDVDNLYHAAVEAIGEARQRRQLRFSVGLSRIVPREWGLEDGMGPCGISAFAMRFEDGGTFAYVVLDGNNMRSGLRECIIGALKPDIVDDAEVVTTDTHIVNAIGVTTRGYSPIGERMDEQVLMEYVARAVRAARSNPVECSVSHSRTLVRGLTVLGEAGLNLLGDVLESAFGLFKRVALLTTSISLLASVIVILII